MVRKSKEERSDKEKRRNKKWKVSQGKKRRKK